MSLRQTARDLWHVQRIKRLVRDRIGGGAQCIVSVRETICTDPGCEGPATDIRVVTVAFTELRTMIHKGLSDVTDLDVAAAL